MGHFYSPALHDNASDPLFSASSCLIPPDLLPHSYLYICVEIRADLQS